MPSVEDRVGDRGDERNRKGGEGKNFRKRTRLNIHEHNILNTEQQP
jgi:hypothetical protein